MARKRNKRTKTAYAELFDNPSALFQDAEVLLWPNGVPEIWIRSKDGRKGFRITAGQGNAGFALTIGKFALSAPMTVGGNLQKDMEVFHAGDAYEVSLCQYNDDELSQAFKRWYHHTGDEATRPPYPDKLEAKKSS